MDFLRNMRNSRQARNEQQQATNTSPDNTVPPPSYSRVVTRIYPYSLRPIVIAIGIMVFFYGMIYGTSAIRGLSEDTAKEKVWDIVLGALWLVVGGVGVGMAGVAFMHKLPLTRIYRPVAILGAILAIAAQTLQLVCHYVIKSDEIEDCVEDYVGSVVYDGNYNNVTTITQSQAESLCQSSWNRGTLRDVFELILAIALGTLFILLTEQYHRQLLNPSAVRVRGQPQRQSAPSYPMEAPTIPYGYGEPGVGPTGYQPYHQQGGYVPPYPGPPPADSPYAPKTNTYAKEETEGKGSGMYGQTGGANGSSVALADEMSYDAQEAAWRDAQSRGPTVNTLTGSSANGGGRGYAAPSGAPPGRSDTGEVHGYGVGRNEEEDEAWERARREGPTAHLTGDRGGSGAVV